MKFVLATVFVLQSVSALAVTLEREGQATPVVSQALSVTVTADMCRMVSPASCTILQVSKVLDLPKGGWIVAAETDADSVINAMVSEATANTNPSLDHITLQTKNGASIAPALGKGIKVRLMYQGPEIR